MSLEYASADMKNNENVLTFAVLQKGMSLEGVSVDLRAFGR